MRSSSLRLIGLLLAFAGAAQAEGLQAWWEICDSCTPDSEFRARAVLIPFPHERVYISNSRTNETRRFQRSFTENDSQDGASLLVVAHEQSLTAEEADLFEAIEHNSRETFSIIERSELDNFSGLTGRDSVLGDLATGMLSRALLSGLQTYLSLNGFSGASSSVAAESGIDSRIPGYSLTVNLNRPRTQSLLVRIAYPDRSSLQIELDKNLSDVLAVNAIDASESEIPFDRNGRRLSVIPVNGRKYSFGTARADWGEQFRQALDALEGVACSSRNVEDSVMVVCSRT